MYITTLTLYNDVDVKLNRRTNKTIVNLLDVFLVTYLFNTIICKLLYSISLINSKIISCVQLLQFIPLYYLINTSA